MKLKAYCVILAGGIGSRLWPTSGKNRPKQFLDIFGTGRTLLQETYDRYASLFPEENILISTYDGYLPLIREQLPQVREEQILSEPVQLGTGPAAIWASHHVGTLSQDATMLLSPCDLQIKGEESFLKDVTRGLDFVAKRDAFLSLGIRPSMPCPTYGYIQTGEDTEEEGVSKVKSFSEKPGETFAKMFMESGEFLWNTGLFLWKISTMRTFLNSIMPEMEPYLEQRNGSMHMDEKEIVRKYYPSSLHSSIDLIILEQSKNVYVECGSFGWADLGQWSTLFRLAEKDENDNAVIGGGGAILHDCRGNIIHLSEGHTAVMGGIEDCILSEKDGIILLCKKDDPARVRKLATEAQLTL